MPRPSASQPDLSGMRILVVEDMMLVAEEISEALRDSGCIVVGPAARVGEALGLLDGEALDGALLDVNLGGELCFPVAEVLRLRRVPVIFLTGYSEAKMFPEAFRETPRLTKPFDVSAIARAVHQHFYPA